MLLIEEQKYKILLFLQIFTHSSYQQNPVPQAWCK